MAAPASSNTCVSSLQHDRDACGRSEGSAGAAGPPSGPPGACGAPAHPISPCPVVRWSIDGRGPALAPRALVQQGVSGASPTLGSGLRYRVGSSLPMRGIAAGRPAPPMHAAALAAAAGRRLTPPPSRRSPQRSNVSWPPETDAHTCRTHRKEQCGATSATGQPVGAHGLPWRLGSPMSFAERRAAMGQHWGLHDRHGALQGTSGA